MYAHYVAAEQGGIYHGFFYNNNTVGYPQIVAVCTLSNETCQSLGYTAATADEEYRELARAHGVSAGGHCVRGYFLDQTTAKPTSNTWYEQRNDPRLRPWYSDAKNAKRRTWAPIFTYNTPPYPVVIGAGRLVCGCCK